jgi:LmbE family N-acetylglucosaminyl deacetylase
MTSATASPRPACASTQAEIHRAGWLSVDANVGADARLTGPVPEVPADGPLPRVGTVLAVTARPGQESAELGTLLHAFHGTGASLALLCLTRGEASPLNSTYLPLEAIRPWELQLAASVLGISSVAVANYPDGGLGRYPLAELTEHVRRAIREHKPGLLLVIDPAAGDPDDTAVAAATCAAARQAGVPAVARTVPAVSGAWVIDLGAEAAAARAIQRSAVAAHVSQSEALPQLKRRLDSLDGQEYLRWLIPQDESTPSKSLAAAHAPVTGPAAKPGFVHDEA